MMHPSNKFSLTVSKCLSIWLVLLVGLAFGGGLQQRERHQPAIGLAVRIQGRTLGSGHPGGGNQLIRRSQFKIIDEAAAGDFTAIDMVCREEGGAMRVNLSVVYNDLNNQEWWKDKKEKPAGSYLIHEGETIPTMELERFGIEPFEISVVDARPVAIRPSERPFITNRTQSLRVVGLERVMDTYRLTLKNVGEKTITQFNVLHRGAGYSTGGIRPGALHEVHLSGPRLEEEGINIRGVVFEDGSFEGDAQEEALIFLAGRQGQRIQAPSVLARVRETMEAGDAELPAAVERLEAGLWTIPEAIDKASALKLLKSEYPSLDDKWIGQLYELLKGGLYYARNRALMPLGELKRRLAEGQLELSPEYKVTEIRRVLKSIQEEFEGIIAGAPR
jgi:hypothetical protein